MNSFRRMQIALMAFSTILFLVSFTQAQPRIKSGTRNSGASSATKTGDSKLSDQQQKNIERLQSDLNAIKQGSQVTQNQITALKNDLIAIAERATRPDPALVDKLATDLANALADGKLSNAEKARLSQDLYAVLNSANISTAEINQAIADAQTILQASGITKNEVTAVINDLKAIANEAQSNAQSGGGKAKTRKPTGN